MVKHSKYENNLRASSKWQNKECEIETQIQRFGTLMKDEINKE
jgi:hypothetical protein